ncbi:ATP-binding protein [Planotetraspora thailandica]|nr:ATP-binding protein [Planotetraspora thailandica]
MTATTLSAEPASAPRPHMDPAFDASLGGAQRYRAAPRPAPQPARRPVPGRRVTWVLPDEPAAVTQARHLIGETLTGWQVPDQIDVAELLADELITNALHHAWGKPLLTLSLIDGVLRCEVNDLSPELPRMRQPDADETSGRGLLLLERLSLRWGSVRTYSGKVVWFEMAARS